MRILKRNGNEVQFDKKKIVKAILNANREVEPGDRLDDTDAFEIADKIELDITNRHYNCNVEDIQDMVEDMLISRNKAQLAKKYIKYRYIHSIRRDRNNTDNQILSLIDCSNEEIKQENSNKNPIISSVQRDYMAGEVSKDVSRRLLLTDKIMYNHDNGIIHFHDMDYYLQHMHNCSLINLDDMLQNGTVISGTMIEKPHSFGVACTVATQIIAQVASCQYGGQSITLSHLAPFVDISRKKIRESAVHELKDADIPSAIKQHIINKIVEDRLRSEVARGIQTIQYQVVTLMTTNGQAPFVTIFMYIDEVPEGQTRDDLVMIIEETIKQRIKGVKNEVGQYITPAFPKLIYVLDEDNIDTDSKYYYLTKLAANCTAKRMVPDYISAKVMKQLKGEVYPCMGAAIGDEKVSIKIHGEVFNDIRIEDAIKFIRVATKHTRSYSSELTGYRGLSGVYKITHKPSKLFYIGSSKDIGRRISEHKYTMRHNKSLGDNYFIGDDNTDNLEITILEECSWDDLAVTESKWYNMLKCDKCVNHKDPINNGNFDSYNRLLALDHIRYSTYTNRQHTWVRDIVDSEIKIMSNSEWVPIRKIMINSEECPLKLYEINYIKNDKLLKLKITEDHPMHTQRGRVLCRDLVAGDSLIDAVSSEMYTIKEIYQISDKLPTFDFETDNDAFDLSGLLSHNCRSFLTPDRFTDAGVGNVSKCKNYDPNSHKYYSRFNQGVVTINLVDAALSASVEMSRSGLLYEDIHAYISDMLDIFWRILDERLSLCHEALRLRHERLLGTKSDVAPILWQYGALARLDKGETIDKLLYDGYSTISLGYAGLWECVYALINKKLTEPEGEQLGLEIMKKLNEYTNKWKIAENIDYSLYGTPIESTTYKFAKCLKKRFGIIPGVTDKNYITNSYHVHVTEKIDAEAKLKLESKFQALSPGGAISYIEVPNMSNNIDAVISILRIIYDNIMYAELNTKSDYCQVCGYDGEIQIVEDDDKLVWECPNCKNRDQSKMNVARRTCGYIGSQFWNQGRTEEIKERVLHVD